MSTNSEIMGSFCRGVPLIVLTLAVFLAPVSPGAAADPPEKTSEISRAIIGLAYVPGEIVVVFEAGTDAAVINAVVEELGGAISETSVFDPGRFVISVPEGEEESYIEAYRNSPFVAIAEKNYIVKTQSEPGEKDPELKTVIGE